MKLTVLMPCLNESETIGICIQKALGYMKLHDVDGEVLIADNGSTDDSVAIAEKLGARVVHVQEKGYGAALRGGIADAKGKYVIMADSDDSYDFSNLSPFIEKLDEGYDLVMGNRFLGGIEPGAMPPLHKYLGNPVLSFLGNLFFKTPVKDFHCGLRGFSREKILELDLQTNGMEFASEMVVKATLADLRMIEVPTTLSKDGRSGSPHLRSWRDGWRHLRFLLMFTPKWLFWLPALILFIMGALILSASIFNHATSDYADQIIGEHWIFLASTMIQTAHLSLLLGFAAHFYSIKKQIRVMSAQDQKLLPFMDFNLLVFSGIGLILLGLGVLIGVFVDWVGNDLADPQSMLPAAFGILSAVLGFQNIFGGFIFAILSDFDAELKIFKPEQK